MANRKSSWLRRSLKLIPATAVTLIILLVLALMNLLNFDVPSLDQAAQETSSPESEETAEEQTSTDERMLTVQRDGGETQSEKTQSAEEADIDPATVDVLIDGDRYLVNEPRGPETRARQAISLEQVIELAKAAEGDASGVRVRITRTFAATAQADQRLRRALEEAGLHEDEIDHRRTLVRSEDPNP